MRVVLINFFFCVYSPYTEPRFLGIAANQTKQDSQPRQDHLLPHTAISPTETHQGGHAEGRPTKVLPEFTPSRQHRTVKQVRLFLDPHTCYE